MLSVGDIPRKRSPRLRRTSHLLLAVQVMSLLHLLLVRHVTCPEHGDIIHVRHANEAARATADALDDADFSPVANVAASPTVDGEHDRCLVCAVTSRRLALLPPATWTFADDAAAVFLLAPVKTDLLASADLILLSPKNSPPAA